MPKKTACGTKVRAMCFVDQSSPYSLADFERRRPRGRSWTVGVYTAIHSTTAVCEMTRSPKKTSVLTVRITPEVRAALQRAAADERRSLANMLEVAVLSYCAARKPSGKQHAQLGAEKPVRSK
jgi:hypothetical protein